MTFRGVGVKVKGHGCTTLLKWTITYVSSKQLIFIPPATKLGGVYWNQSVRLSVRPSVRRPLYSFPDIFLINFSGTEKKLGMIVYNNASQIKFEFRCY